MFTARALSPSAAYVALAVLALVAGACGYQNPTQPAGVPFSETTPATLSINATSGTGTNGGTAILTARVQNGHGTNLPAIRVRFTTDVGTLSAASADTIADGTATITLTASSTATINASAGTLTARTLALSNTATPGNGVLSVEVFVVPGYVGSDTVFTASVKNGSGIPVTAWTFGDGASQPGQSSTSTAHPYASRGTYAITASVTDPDGRTARGDVTTTITNAPTPPPPTPAYVVSLAASPSSVLVGGSVTLTATVTLQSGAPTPTSYVWDCQGNGATVTSGTTTRVCTYPAAGAFSASVTVTGGTVSGAASTSVSVSALPLPSYSVSLAAAPSTILVGASSTLTATVSAQNGAPPPTQFVWTFDDGGTFTTASNVSPAHVYSTAGTFAPSVLVTGPSPVTGSASTSVTVSTAIPVVTVNCSTGVHVGAPSNCNVSATLDGVVMPSTSITHVDWDFGDGTGTFPTSSNVSGPHTYPFASTFTVVAIATVTGGTSAGTGSTMTTILP
jgi:hypothetical protein